ncbi:DEAD/DEAH box helicase [bacterium]|nr:DEAD/DEAH box helicase [bacterium]
MRAVAPQPVVAPPGTCQAGRRDGRTARAATFPANASRASRRACVRASAAAADVVDIPEQQDAIDDSGAKVGSLTKAVMALEDDSAEAMFECILEWATDTKNMELYEAQEEAIMELVEGNSVLLTTPTGSGKTLVATAAIAAATARGDVRN